MFRFSDTFLSLIVFFICVPGYPGIARGQITFEDLKAGYLENESKLKSRGLRIIFRYRVKTPMLYDKVTELNYANALKPLLDHPALTEADRSLIKEQIESSTWAAAQPPPPVEPEVLYDLAYDRHGVAFRSIVLPESTLPGESILELLKESKTMSAFDLNLAPWAPESLFWSASENCTREESNIAGLRSFGIAAGKFNGNRFVPQRPAFLNPDPIHYLQPNTPVIVPGFPAVSSHPEIGTFLAPGDIVYRWRDSPDTIREVRMLDDHLVELECRTPLAVIPFLATDSIRTSQAIISTIDTSRGYLPVKIEWKRRTEIDGQIFTPKNPSPGKSCVAELEIGEIDGAFFIKRFQRNHSTLEMDYPVNVSLRLWDPVDRIRFTASDRNQSLTNPKMKLVEQLTLEVDWVGAFDSNEGSVFRPERPEGIRYLNQITGESSLGGDAVRALQLDLEAGEKPVSDLFQSESSADQSSSIGLFTVLFWLAVFGIGFLMVVLSKKMARKP